jgi:hypothetical protein
MADWELLPKDDAPRREQPVEAPDRKKRLTMAFAVAGVSDLLSVWLGFVPPLQWALDILTAGLLFILLGRQWLILPGLIAEAIPGLAVFPFWVLVVGSIAVWGKISKRTV